MTDFSDMGARRVPGEPAGPDELTPQQLKRAQEEALSAFRIMNPASESLIKTVGMTRGYLYGCQRKLKEFTEASLRKLLDDDLIDESDLEIISEHICRRMADAHSAADGLIAIHDELLITDLNAILTRYKGE